MDLAEHDARGDLAHCGGRVAGHRRARDWKRVVLGKRVDLGGCRIIKKKKKICCAAWYGTVAKSVSSFISQFTDPLQLMFCTILHYSENTTSLTHLCPSLLF